jgi:hypothetical protein
MRGCLPIAVAALLVTTSCVMAPVAFHDGLPAWTPAPRKAEASVGYHRMFWSEDSNSIGYLTPGVRVGLARPPLAAEVGLTSMIMVEEGDMMALLGPEFGIGYQNQYVSIVGRPTLHLLSFYGDTVLFGADQWWQFSLLVGNSYRTGKVHVSAGGRMSEYGIGPLVLVDGSLGPVNLRIEGSYMVPNSEYVEGELLSVGLTVAGPAW